MPLMLGKVDGQSQSVPLYLETLGVGVTNEAGLQAPRCKPHRQKQIPFAPRESTNVGVQDTSSDTSHSGVAPVLVLAWFVASGRLIGRKVELHLRIAD